MGRAGQSCWTAPSSAAAVGAVQRYYERTESRLGYRALLGETKHFGWYEPGQSMWSFGRAMRRMEDELAIRLALPSASRVLDAGCGVGDVARRLAGTHGLCVTGIDVLDFNLDKARARSAKQTLAGATSFRYGDYHSLDFGDASFDGAYTMETVVHSPSPATVVGELFRVLRPGGSLVMVEYSRATPSSLSAAAETAFAEVCELAAMPGWLELVPGKLEEHLAGAGFESVTRDDVTERMLPMLRAFHLLGRIPYFVGRVIKQRAKVVNALSAVEMYRHQAAWRYNIYTARKPLAG